MQHFQLHLHFFPAAPPRLNLPPTTSSSFLRLRTMTIPSAYTTSSPNLPALKLPEQDSSSVAFQDYQILFASQPAECLEPLPLRVAEGALPSDFPRGTYYLVGPGVTADDHGSTVSPLDGHGYLRAFRFLDGDVLYSARHVETEAAKEEGEKGTRKWRFAHPGFFSQLKARRWPAPIMPTPKNVANTCVLRWGGRLFCLWEGGRPYEIDPASLSTIGPVDFTSLAKDGGHGLTTSEGFAGNLLRQLFGKAQKRTVAHYKIDAQRNRLLVLYCNVVDPFLHRSNLTFCEFDTNFELKQRKEFLVPDNMMIHDWGFTDHHYILMANRIKMDLSGSWQILTGQAPMISLVSKNPSQNTTPIYLLPRFSNAASVKRDWRIPVEAPSQLWVTHIGNAYENRDRSGNTEIHIQASVCSYKWLNFQKMFGYDWKTQELDPSVMNAADEDGEKVAPHLVQVSIELDAKGSSIWCSVANPSSQWSKFAEFPVINPTHSGRHNMFMYACSTSGSRQHLPIFPTDTIVKQNLSIGSVKTWSPEKRSFVGEPMFVPRGVDDEEDGYVLVVEYAVWKQRCYLVVLDAKRIGFEDGVVTKLEVPKRLLFPWGFHGFWDGE